MTTSILQRTTAWLCLAAAFLTGLTPAQGFVICLEPDGRVSIEIAAPSESCGGCEGRGAIAAPTKSAVRAAEVVDCPCLDLPVPGTSQERRLQQQSLELRFGPWSASPASAMVRSLLPAPIATRAPHLEAPRPAESLALIRSVVLLV